LEVRLIIRALHEIHLPGKELPLVGPLAVEHALPMLELPELLLLAFSGLLV